MESSEIPAHLDPSALGTKQYWDDAYTLELTNHTLQPSDVGTIWFSDSLAEEKILAYLLTLDLSHITHADPAENPESEDVRILDLGTGNGHLLYSLRDEGWKAQMVGVDYSEGSVELARAIGVARRREGKEGARRDEEAEDKEGKGEGQSAEDVEVREGDGENDEDDDQEEDDDHQTDDDEDEDEDQEEARQKQRLHQHLPDPLFAHFDIMSALPSPPPPWLGPGFDLVLDKGTFDAISLSPSLLPTSTNPLRRAYEAYAEKVTPLIRPGGYLLITSCNWTSAEVRKWFEREELGLRYEGEVRYRGFVFGGVKGQTVCSLCFRRVVEEGA